MTFSPYEPPKAEVENDPAQPASPTQERAGRRFVRAFALWCVLTCAFAAATWTLQVAAFMRLGAKQLIDGLVALSALSAVRALAPANACAAAVLALVSWAHGLKLAELMQARPGMFQRAVLIAFVATPGLAVLLLLMTSVGMMTYGVSPQEFLVRLRTLRAVDFLMAPLILGLHMGVAFPLTWLGLELAAKTRMSLAAKLLAACILLWLVRIPLSYGFSAAYTLFTQTKP